MLVQKGIKSIESYLRCIAIVVIFVYKVLNLFDIISHIFVGLELITRNIY